jgi:hypothetical protein
MSIIIQIFSAVNLKSSLCYKDILLYLHAENDMYKSV